MSPNQTRKPKKSREEETMPEADVPFEEENFEETAPEDPESVDHPSGENGAINEDEEVFETSPELRDSGLGAGFVMPEEQDSGLGAGFVVTEEELEALPGLPAEDVALPPQESVTGMPLFDDSVFHDPGPGRQPPPPVGTLTADEKLVGLLVTDARIQALWDRADSLVNHIDQRITSVDAASELLDQLMDAKSLLLEKRANFEEAERRVNEVSFRVEYICSIQHEAPNSARFVLLYESAWGLVFFVAAIYFIVMYFQGVQSGWFTAESLQDQRFLNLSDMFVALGAVLTGGLGGVLGALYALWNYVSKQTFDPAYRFWYYVQPIMGMPIGVFIFLFIMVGFNVTAGSVEVAVGNPFLVYLLALIAGFQQNVVYSIVRQVLRLFKIETEEKK